VISEGKAFISINRDIRVEWTEGIDDEVLVQMLMKAVHIAQQGVEYDAR